MPGALKLIESARRTIVDLQTKQQINESAAEILFSALLPERTNEQAPRSSKNKEEIRFLLALIKEQRSIEHAQRISRTLAKEGLRALQDAARLLSPSKHLSFLRGLATFVLDRES